MTNYKSGCDYCGEDKVTSGSKQTGNGQFQRVFLCDDCKPIVHRLNEESKRSERSRNQYLEDIRKSWQN